MTENTQMNYRTQVLDADRLKLAIERGTNLLSAGPFPGPAIKD